MKRLIEIDLQYVGEETSETFVYEVSQLLRNTGFAITATWAFSGDEGFIVISGESNVVEDVLDDISELHKEFPSIMVDLSKVKTVYSRD